MVAAPGFRVDFERFLQMGRIGASAAIDLPNDTATWGDVLTFTVQCDEPAELTAWRGHQPAINARPLQTWRINGGEHEIQWHCTDDVVFKLQSGPDLLDDAALKVVRPAARFQVLSPHECQRYDPAQLAVQLQYAVEAYLRIPGQVGEQRLPLAAANAQSFAERPWVTGDCGQQHAQVRALGLDGHWQNFDVWLVVTPRPVRCAVQSMGQGTYQVHIEHAVPTELELPLLGSWQPLLQPTFELSYAGVLPMLARVHVRDDAGKLEAIEIELEHEVRWQELPAFSQALGWTT